MHACDAQEVAKICVKSLDKPRDFALKAGTVLVTDFNDILNDPSINTVVELMGGVTRSASHFHTRTHMHD